MFGNDEQETADFTSTKLVWILNMEVLHANTQYIE